MDINAYKIQEDEFNCLSDRFKTLKAIRDDEAKYFMIALNLSGQREQLENKAFELIQEKGLLKALIYSRGETI